MALLESILLVTAPVIESPLPDDAGGWARARPSAFPGEVTRELDAEVARLLRVRSSELAEPLLWRRASHRREVDAVVRQLGPIRTRSSLLSSWQRESRRSAQVRLAYAIAWLALARARPAAATRHARRRTRRVAVTTAG